QGTDAESGVRATASGLGFPAAGVGEIRTVREEITMRFIRERIGIFSGFGESKYEIISNVLLPYHRIRMPLQGSFLVVLQEDHEGRASGILGRVISAAPIGELFSNSGEDYLVDLMRLGYEVPEEVKQGRLRYRLS